jgi:hypothetical protein
MATERVGGVFALAGVALAAVFAEVRARRESRSREAADLLALKRKIYGTAVHQVEVVASGCTQWFESTAENRPAAKRSFWDALTIAYQISNEIRLVSTTERPADAMKRMLTVYRDAVEKDSRDLPKPREIRDEMIGTFRQDLGLPNGGRHSS